IAAGTYNELVVVDRSLTLAGAGTFSTIIDGSSSGTVLTIGANSASLSVRISHLAIRDGVGRTGGGVTSVPGTGQTNTVILSRVNVKGNHANGNNASGGGIYNAVGSTVTISRSNVSGNSAGDGNGFGFNGEGDGGGVYNAGTLKVTGSTISGNTARGGYGSNGTVGGPGQGGGLY